MQASAADFLLKFEKGKESPSRRPGISVIVVKLLYKGFIVAKKAKAHPPHLVPPV
jgi:hypothetical protein